MKKLILLLTVLLLTSCYRTRTEQIERAGKRMGRLIGKFPELQDTTTRVDSVLIVDSIEAKAKELTKPELDSLLSEFCKGDTILKDSIRERIIYLTRLENMLPERSIYNLENGRVTIDRKGGFEKVKFESWEKKETKQVIRYITPDCPACDWKEDLFGWYWLIWFALGSISTLLVRVFIKQHIG